jgi:predicted MFS family arabinose efflux permease
VSLWRIPGLRALGLLSVLAFSSFFLTLSSLPLWAVDGGAPVGSAGIVTTALLAATVACQLLVPAAERRLGLPRLLAIGLVSLGLPTPLYLVSQDLAWLAAVSAVRGVGFAIVTVMGATLTAQLAPDERRGEAIGLYGIAVAIPNLLCVPGGASLALAGHFPIVAALAAVPLLALPLVGAFAGIELSRGATGGRGALRAVLPACIVLAVVTAVGGGLVTFLPVGRPDGAVAALALLAYGIAGALGRWRVGHVVDRRGSTHVLLPVTQCLTAAGIAVVAAGLSAGAGGLVVLGAAITGCGYGAVQNLTLVAALARAGPGRAGTASAMWNASFDTGTAAGAWAVGAIAEAGPGLSATYLGCAVLVLLVIPVGAVAGGVTVLRPAPPAAAPPRTRAGRARRGSRR